MAFTIQPDNPAAPKPSDTVMCSKCKNEWLELIMVQRFQRFHAVVFGQKPPAKEECFFYMFRCPLCGEMFEPNVQIYKQDIMAKMYNGFLDLVEKVKSTIKGEKV